MPVAATPVTARRYDRGGTLLKAHRRESDGVLLAECIPTREGILEYARADGTIRRELVTRQALLDTARTAPRSAMTLLHPKEGFIKADSYARLGVGDVDGASEVLEDAQGGFVKLKIAVRRDDALASIESGETTELSLGYDVKLDETPGDWTNPATGKAEHYDAAQVGRDCNHLALVPKGRAVTDLRVDSADACQVDASCDVNLQMVDKQSHDRSSAREDSMNPSFLALLAALGVMRTDSEPAALTAGLAATEKLKADAAKRKDAEEAVAASGDELTKAKAALAAIQTELDKLKGEATTKDGELAAVKAENEEMKKADAARKDAAELTRLQGVATKLGIKHDGVALPALRIALAKTRIDSIDDKTAPAFVDGVLASVVADAGKRGDDNRWDFARTGEDGKRKDGADDERRKDSHFSPALTHADDARKAASSPGSTR